MNNLLKRTVAFFAGGICMLSVHAQDGEKIFKPGDTKDWYVYLAKHDPGQDPEQVFKFEGDVLHVSGKEFGYITTKKKYADFHLTLEFKWGEKKYPPRENAKRDAGVLYHTDFYNGDKIWPRSLEFQVQEGDCGDFWMTDSTVIIHNGSVTKAGNNVQVVKSKDAEKPTGEWNKAEVIVKDGEITHLLNGEVVNSGKLSNTKTGTIVLQSEGAEIYYRNVRVQEL
ncbi:MAG: DUF1080 domain-containing protein [Ferruginibacter sp.]